MESEEREELANLFRHLRSKVGWSQATLASRAGTSLRAASYLENSPAKVSSELKAAFALTLLNQLAENAVQAIAEFRGDGATVLKGLAQDLPLDDRRRHELRNLLEQLSEGLRGSDNPATGMLIVTHQAVRKGYCAVGDPLCGADSRLGLVAEFPTEKYDRVAVCLQCLDSCLSHSGLHRGSIASQFGNTAHVDRLASALSNRICERRIYKDEAWKKWNDDHSHTALASADTLTESMKESHDQLAQARIASTIRQAAQGDIADECWKGDFPVRRRRVLDNGEAIKVGCTAASVGCCVALASLVQKNHFQIEPSWDFPFGPDLSSAALSGEFDFLISVDSPHYICESSDHYRYVIPVHWDANFGVSRVSHTNSMPKRVLYTPGTTGDEQVRSGMAIPAKADRQPVPFRRFQEASELDYGEMILGWDPAIRMIANLADFAPVFGTQRKCWRSLYVNMRHAHNSDLIDAFRDYFIAAWNWNRLSGIPAVEYLTNDPAYIGAFVKALASPS